MKWDYPGFLISHNLGCPQTEQLKRRITSSHDCGGSDRNLTPQHKPCSVSLFLRLVLPTPSELLSPLKDKELTGMRSSLMFTNDISMTLLPVKVLASLCELRLQHIFWETPFYPYCVTMVQRQTFLYKHGVEKADENSSASNSSIWIGYWKEIAWQQGLRGLIHNQLT